MNAVLYWLGIYLLIGLTLTGTLYAWSKLKKNLEQVGSPMSWQEQAVGHLALLLIWPLALGMFLHERLFDRPKPTPIYRTWTATPESLIEKLAVNSIEQQQIYSDPLNAVPPVPFGHLHDAWQRFCQTLQEGDQLWSFKIDTREDDGLDYLNRRGIVEGYAVLRSGEISGEFFAHVK